MTAVSSTNPQMDAEAGVADPFVNDADLREDLFEWLCRIGDTTLIMGHRLSEWCGRAPVLEEDIAVANTALDLIGHTQMWLGLAGEVEGKGRSDDDLAYLRDSFKFRNLLIAELPKGDMAVTTMRLFLFDAWYHELLVRLQDSRSPRIAEIAAKAIKEVVYQLDRSSDLVVRLGDGTEESHTRMQRALDHLWPYIDEMFDDDAVDEAVAAHKIAPQPSDLRAAWTGLVSDVLKEATLVMPEPVSFAQRGGKTGRHTEHLGYILAEMQFLQRSYPGVTW